MTIDKARLKALAEAAMHPQRTIHDEHDLLYRFQHACDPAEILALLAEIDKLKAALDMESAELAWSDSDGREIQAERDKLRAELAGLRSGYDAQNAVIAGLKVENEDLRMRVKEIDLMFGHYLLGMRASVIEWQDGKGADAAMQWIWNGLAGPGELPPPEEKEAQPYFDREFVQIENAQQEVFAYWDRRRAEKAKEASHD